MTALNVDMGGDTLYVSDIFIGDNTPGNLTGTSISSLANAAFGADARMFHSGGQPMITASTPGTNVAAGSATSYFAETAVGYACTALGVCVFNGTTANATTFVYLTNASGSLLATGSATQSGASAYQRIPFSTSALLAQGSYFVGLQNNSTTGTYFMHLVGDFGVARVTSSAGIYPTSFTGATTFTASLGPIASLF